MQKMPVEHIDEGLHLLYFIPRNLEWFVCGNMACVQKQVTHSTEFHLWKYFNFHPISIK